MDFLWHKVSEKEKEAIKKEAKELMDSFEKELKKIKEEIKFEGIKRTNQLREENKEFKSKIYDEDFKKRFFENAPSKEGDFIKSEKGKWK